MVQYGMVWHGVVWYCTVWYGLLTYGNVWHRVAHCPVWYMVPYDPILSYMVPYGPELCNVHTQLCVEQFTRLLRTSWDTRWRFTKCFLNLCAILGQVGADEALFYAQTPTLLPSGHSPSLWNSSTKKTAMSFLNTMYLLFHSSKNLH